jgi:predicted AAA+ superfamily ATPase
MGYMIPAYQDAEKRKNVQAPKFYYFDVGVANYLLHRKNLVRGTVEFGHAFEHLVMQELLAYIGYRRRESKLTYWHTYTGSEVDAIIDKSLAIEIKSSENLQNRHLKGLRAFRQGHIGFRLIAVSLDPMTRKTEDNIELIFVRDFFRMLWSGELF